jgi:RNase P subunit RPR2
MSLLCFPYLFIFFCFIFFFSFQAAHTALQTGNKVMSRFYVQTMRAIAQRLVLRLYAVSLFIYSTSNSLHREFLYDSACTSSDPAIKRTLCKRCSQLLIPGITASVRIRGMSAGLIKCISELRLIGCILRFTLQHSASAMWW